MVGDYSQGETLESYMSLVRERPELFHNKDERGIEIPFPHRTIYVGEPKAGPSAPMNVIVQYKK